MPYKQRVTYCINTLSHSALPNMGRKFSRIYYYYCYFFIQTFDTHFPKCCRHIFYHAVKLSLLSTQFISLKAKNSIGWWHIVWPMLTAFAILFGCWLILMQLLQKLAVALKWSNKKTVSVSSTSNMDGKSLKSLEFMLNCRWPQVAHMHINTPLPNPPPTTCLSLSCISSQIWCGGGRVRAEGAHPLLSPLELTEQPPAFLLKPPAGDGRA